jgi:HEAT repeat protein
VVRSEAAKALGTIRDPFSVEPLIDTLRDKNMQVRDDVIQALQQIGTPSVDRLIFALKDGDIHIRSSSAIILGEIRDSRAVVPLIEALRDESWVVRSEAAKALGNVQDPRAIEPLRDAMNDRDSYVRDIAAGALENILRKK